jgi:UDP-3-O-acyl N-acetylglucosamine deacetylase
VVITGVGLHSGIKTGLILTPLPPNSGIIFGDISTGRQVKADLDYVESTEFCTMLKFGSTSVKTIEHIMAALHMYGISNALIKVGDEVPIMDGSAVELCDLIENGGIEDQHEPVEPITVNKTIAVGEPEGDNPFLMIEPSDRLEIEYRMDYPPPVGRLKTTYVADGVESFKSEIAPARTFGFVKQIKQVAKQGFAEGGRLTNVILIDDERVINTTLRFEDEFARHKILDFIGDSYLLGRPLMGKVTANMTGHTQNVMLLKEIRSSLGIHGNVAATGA